MSFQFDSLHITHQLTTGIGYPNFLGYAEDVIRGSVYLDGPTVIGDETSFQNVEGSLMVGPCNNTDSPLPLICTDEKFQPKWFVLYERQRQEGNIHYGRQTAEPYSLVVRSGTHTVRNSGCSTGGYKNAPVISIESRGAAFFDGDVDIRGHGRVFEDFSVGGSSDFYGPTVFYSRTLYGARTWHGKGITTSSLLICPIVGDGTCGLPPVPFDKGSLPDPIGDLGSGTTGRISSAVSESSSGESGALNAADAAPPTQGQSGETTSDFDPNSVTPPPQLDSDALELLNSMKECDAEECDLKPGMMFAYGLSSANLSSVDLLIKKQSTFENGPVFIGSTVSIASTADYKLQVDSGTYISGDSYVSGELSADNGIFRSGPVFIGSTVSIASTETYNIQVNGGAYVDGDLAVSGIVTANVTGNLSGDVIAGVVTSNTYVVGSSITTNDGTTGTFDIDSSTYQYYHHVASFNGNKNFNISNLTPGRSIYMYIRNTNAGNRTIFINASATSSGHTAVNLSRSGSGSVSNFTITATNGTALVWLVNMGGNIVGSLS